MKTRLHLAHLPPSINHAYSHTRKGVRRSDSYMTWINGETHFLKRQMAGQTRFQGPVYVTLAMKRPRSNADIDNRLKPIGDMLQRLEIIANDKLIMGWNAFWSADLPEGVAAEISIVEADGLEKAA
jgi:Holliday junction resolvase RusA-like endonuclease